MPSNQTAKSSSRASAGAGERRQPQSQPAARAQRPQGRGQTGERDENYALVSVLYHALQGAETIDQYVEDARAAQDEELASFLAETKASYVERAAEAKQLLAARLESEEEDDEDDGEEQEEEEEEED